MNYNAINDGRSRYLKNNAEQGNNKLPQTSNTKKQLLGQGVQKRIKRSNY